MPLFNLKVKHHRTKDDARGRLAHAVDEARSKFGPMVQRVDWADDRDSVRMSGVGFAIDMRVDDEHVHVSGDVPILGGLLGGPLTSGLKAILARHFPKGLT
jgi:hypothetical protein